MRGRTTTLMEKRVPVTGGAGFISSHLDYRIRQDGHANLVVVDGASPALGAPRAPVLRWYARVQSYRTPLPASDVSGWRHAATGSRT